MTTLAVSVLRLQALVLPLRTSFVKGLKVSQVQIKKISWWMERMADLMLLRPDLTQGQIAKELGVSQSWFSIVKNSDVWKDYWYRRSSAHGDAVTLTIKEKVAGVTELVIENLAEKIDTKMEAGVLSLPESLEILETLRKYGYGNGGAGEKSPPPTITLNVGMVSVEQVEEARNKLRQNTLPLAVTKVEDAA